MNPNLNHNLNLLIVDDEALARGRLRTLVGDCSMALLRNVHQAANTTQAQEILNKHSIDVILLDIHMPGNSGLSFAHQLHRLPNSPAIIFVTAHAEHALRAFEIDAVDYLTKPVRIERLRQALLKAQRHLEADKKLEAIKPVVLSKKQRNDTLTKQVFVFQERGRTERIPMAEILYFKAEQKYVTVCTLSKNYLVGISLNELEDRYPDILLRVHRNALVARHAIRALERIKLKKEHKENDESDDEDFTSKNEDNKEIGAWVVRLQGAQERLLVSRRHLLDLKDVIARVTR